MITIDEIKKKKKNNYKIAKIDPELDGILGKWVSDGIAKSKTDASSKLVPFAKNFKFEIKTLPPKEKIRYLKKDRSRRRKVALELKI